MNEVFDTHLMKRKLLLSLSRLNWNMMLKCCAYNTEKPLKVRYFVVPLNSKLSLKIPLHIRPKVQSSGSICVDKHSFDY